VAQRARTDPAKPPGNAFAVVLLTLRQRGIVAMHRIDIDDAQP
jgi:hypothetical protein